MIFPEMPEPINSFDKETVARVFHTYRSQFDSPPKRYPEDLQIAAAIYATEAGESIRKCAQSIGVQEITLRAWIDKHACLPVRKLSVQKIYSQETELPSSQSFQDRRSQAEGIEDGEIALELPNGCKIRASGSRADAIMELIMRGVGL